jgi:hypothetical protein
MERLEVLITLPLQTVTVPAGATTGTDRVPTTADTIDENKKTLLFRTASATGTINIMMRSNCSNDHSCYEGSPAVFEFSLSNPSAIQYIPTFTNGTAGVLITTLRKQ